VVKGGNEALSSDRWCIIDESSNEGEGGKDSETEYGCPIISRGWSVRPIRSRGWGGGLRAEGRRTGQYLSSTSCVGDTLQGLGFRV